MSVKGMAVFTYNGEDYTINDQNIADEFSQSINYSAGDYCYYQGDLYQFISDHSAGAWNSVHASKKKLAEVVSVNTELINDHTEIINDHTEVINDHTELINDDTELINDLYKTGVNDTVVSSSDFTMNGLLDGQGEFTADSVAGHLCTGFIAIEGGQAYKMLSDTVVRYGFVYNSAKQAIRRIAASVSEATAMVEENAAYVRFNVNTTADFSIYFGYYGLKKDLFDKGFTKLYKIADAKETGKNFDMMRSVVNPNVITTSDFTMHGLLDSSGVYTADSDPAHNCTDYIELEQYVYYKTDYNNRSVPRNGCIYDSSKTFVRNIYMGSGHLDFVLTGDEKYIRICVNSVDFSFYVYPVYLGKDNIAKLKSSVIIPQISLPKSRTIIRKRKPLISFTLDGDYDLNASFVNLFELFGKRLGFAIGYNEFGNNNTVEKYLEWCRNGHEMMCYGVVPLPESSTYTYAQAKAIIEEAYKQLKARGFDTHGFVGSTGAVADRYVPIIKNMFDYASTKANHDGAEESCLFFSTDDPCETWRYSLQLSTFDQMKAAVDRCIAENGLLQYYTHAEENNIQYSTLANVEHLIEYILEKGVEIVTPYEAFTDYYTVRREDVL